jgi:hypothetical protein
MSETFCFGGGSLYATLATNYSKPVDMASDIPMMEQSFVYGMRTYLSRESLQGGPYIKMAYVHQHTTNRLPLKEIPYGHKDWELANAARTKDNSEEVSKHISQELFVSIKLGGSKYYNLLSSNTISQNNGYIGTKVYNGKLFDTSAVSGKETSMKSLGRSDFNFKGNTLEAFMEQDALSVDDLEKYNLTYSKPFLQHLEDTVRERFINKLKHGLQTFMGKES